MLLLKEPVFRHSIFNRKDYAVNSKCPDLASQSPADLSPSYVFDELSPNSNTLAAYKSSPPLPSYPAPASSLRRSFLRWHVIRSVLLMGVSDIFVKLRATPMPAKAVVPPGKMMERLDYALHKVLFSQVVHSMNSNLSSWSYLGVTAAAIIEMVGFLAAITIGVGLIRNSKDPSAMRLTPFDIAVAAGVSQIGKVAPVILMIWSAAPDIRLAVASFNLSTCVVVVKLTSGRKGTPALLVVLTAVAVRLLLQLAIARLYYPMYPCSVISAFG